MCTSRVLGRTALVGLGWKLNFGEFWAELQEGATALRMTRKEERYVPGRSEFENGEAFRFSCSRETLISADEDSPGRTLLAPR